MKWLKIFWSCGKLQICSTYLMICPGIEIFAESAFRIWPLRTLHSIACWILLKFCGRDRRKLCMLANASMAVPSTTSITTQPISDGMSSSDATWTAIAPPMEWPTSIIGGASSGYNFATICPTSLQQNKLSTSKMVKNSQWTYLASVPADKSDSFAT